MDWGLGIGDWGLGIGDWGLGKDTYHLSCYAYKFNSQFSESLLWDGHPARPCIQFKCVIAYHLPPTTYHLHQALVSLR